MQSPYVIGDLCTKTYHKTSNWDNNCCTLMNQIASDSEQQQKKNKQNGHKKTRGVRAYRDQGHGGRWKGDVRYWQWWRREFVLLAAESFMSEIEKDSQRKKWHERGTVRVKEKPFNHLKALWGWHLYILCPSPFANIPPLQKTLSYLVLFCSFIIKKGGWRGKYLWLMPVTQLIDV